MTLSVSRLYVVALNGGVNDKLWIEKDLDGTDRDQTDILFRPFPRGTEENHEEPQSG
jgi:hypothetical protein